MTTTLGFPFRFIFTFWNLFFPSSPLYLPAGFRVKEYHAIARCGKDLSIGTKDEIVKLSTDKNLSVLAVMRQERSIRQTDRFRSVKTDQKMQKPLIRI
jgi:hypothetical protein